MKQAQKNFTIEIDGVSYPIATSLGAMLLFKQETGKEVNEISGIADSIVWLWCCCRSASSLTSTPLELDCQQFADRLTMDTLNRWTQIQQEADREKAKKKTPKGSPAQS